MKGLLKTAAILMGLAGGVGVGFLINLALTGISDFSLALLVVVAILFVGGIALVAVVGRGMAGAKGTAGRLFKAIAENDINIKMIDQGSSELNIIVGIDEEDYVKALNAIYHEFVK